MVDAYVLINCDLGHEQEIIDELHHLDNVKEVHGTFGAYDIIAKVESITSDHLQRFIIQKIRTLANVSTLTLHYEPNLQ